MSNWFAPGEELQSQAYYIVKAAQERQELQAEAQEVAARIAQVGRDAHLRMAVTWTGVPYEEKLLAAPWRIAISCCCLTITAPPCNAKLVTPGHILHTGAPAGPQTERECKALEAHLANLVGTNSEMNQHFRCAAACPSPCAQRGAACAALSKHGRCCWERGGHASASHVLPPHTCPPMHSM